MPEIDLKTVAVIALIAGFIVGVVLDNSIVSKPKISELQNTLTEKESTINTLETELNNTQTSLHELEQDFETLNTTYTTEKTELELEITELEEETESLRTRLNSAQQTIIETESNLDDLINEYNKLLIKYNTVYNPLYVSYTINNLRINLTTTNDVYPENTDISGTVKIQYLDGTPFTGNFTLTVEKIYQKVRTTSNTYEIETQDQGETNYIWNNPFLLGAGSYKISLSDIKNTQGTILATNLELREKAIYLFVG